MVVLLCNYALGVLPVPNILDDLVRVSFNEFYGLFA